RCRARLAWREGGLEKLCRASAEALVVRKYNTTSGSPAAFGAGVPRGRVPGGDVSAGPRHLGRRMPAREGETRMNFELYTERARGFVKAAQHLATHTGQPQLQPGHPPQVPT